MRLTAENALEAYRRGIFPWFERGGFGFWFSPPQRGLLELSELHVSRRLGQLIRQGRYRITIDRAFADVLRGCGARRRLRGEETWITPRFVSVYTELHRRGLAHSVEAWDGDALAGGIYGMHVDGVFSGESMFHAEPNAGKAAFVGLAEHLRSRGLRWMDTQVVTSVVASLGAREISRADYLRRLAEAQRAPIPFLAPDAA
ncbi:MAG TPA: leucyl/phenylalanyl-tRNA--protein transferase [Elusimicrobiota bacterium]|nr:leucyl/phenylalanyl-tRNA--protein transferase [Elusimicrobiota bacterium]